MVLTISQETFDEAVQENINDLEMSAEEALSEAINQFKAQGVDLSQVVTEPGAASALQELTTTIKYLTEFNGGDCSEKLLALKTICDKGIQYRVQAGRGGAYTALLNILLKSETNTALKITTIQTLLSLMTKQPDLLDERGAQIITKNLEKDNDLDIKQITLKWCKECCVMHEMNRQKLMELNIVKELSFAIQNENLDLLKDVLAVLRALMLDDDVRVEFGRAHEHARIIANETLTPITALIKKYKTEESIVNDLLLTLSGLLVRSEFCKTVEEAAGLEIISDVMTNCTESEKTMRQCFKVLKALAGNDEVKAHIIQKGLAPVIATALNNHQGVLQTASAGLGAIAALTLRNPDNSNALFEAQIPEVIVDIMKKFLNEKSIQRSASWAIRNMVSRSRYQNKHFLELGIEQLLLESLTNFKEFEYDIKAALRDLECDVELKEEWTGKGGRITSESSLRKD